MVYISALQEEYLFFSNTGAGARFYPVPVLGRVQPDGYLRTGWNPIGIRLDKHICVTS